jgi:hypothetical protein
LRVGFGIGLRVGFGTGLRVGCGVGFGVTLKHTAAAATEVRPTAHVAQLALPVAA